MLTVNIHKAKTHLSRLVDCAAKGEPFVIAKAGKPLVKVVPLETPEAAQPRRPGFMIGQIAVPDDFDRMGEAGSPATRAPRFSRASKSTGYRLCSKKSGEAARSSASAAAISISAEPGYVIPK
jgi:prevent-host-death family protein